MLSRVVPLPGLIVIISAFDWTIMIVILSVLTTLYGRHVEDRPLR